MADFAVHHEGMAEGAGAWVLHVDGDLLLLASSEGGALYWKDISGCRLVQAHTPSQPTAVVVVQPQQQAGLVVAEPNRAMRRNGHN